MDCNTCNGTGLTGVYPTQRKCAECLGTGKVSGVAKEAAAPVETQQDSTIHTQDAAPAKRGGIFGIFG